MKALRLWVDIEDMYPCGLTGEAWSGKATAPHYTTASFYYLDLTGGIRASKALVGETVRKAVWAIAAQAMSMVILPAIQHTEDLRGKWIIWAAACHPYESITWSKGLTLLQELASP